MPTALRVGGYRFFFYSNEGDPREPPHVHVERGGCDAKVWIGQDPPVLAPGSLGFSAHELLDILRLASEHRTAMEARWHEHFR